MAQYENIVAKLTLQKTVLKDAIEKKLYRLARNVNCRFQFDGINLKKGFQQVRRVKNQKEVSFSEGILILGLQFFAEIFKLLEVAPANGAGKSLCINSTFTLIK